MSGYRCTQGPPLSEADALAQAAEMGWPAIAFDAVVEQDEPLHWHEFAAVTWVIDGTGAVEDGEGNLIPLGPGCRIDAQAGVLHRNLAGPPVRVVLATDIPYAQWTMPIDKDPADRPEHLSV